MQRTPGVSPVMETVLSAVALELETLKTELLSASLMTVTPIVTPAEGIAELTFTTIACDEPTTPKILPAPGSTFTVKAIGDSVGVGGVGVGGVGVGESPPLLQEKNTNEVAIKNKLTFFIQ